MKKLFLSFSTLLRKIADGEVTQADLQTGFFLFGCTRGHALEPGAQNETDERQWNKGKNAAAHAPLVAALLEAEKDGRAGWIRSGPRLADYRDSYEVLNEILVKHGIPSLVRKPDDLGIHSYPALRDAIVEAGLPLEPVF